MPRSLENIGTMWVFLPALENKRSLKNIISSQVIVYFFKWLKCSIYWDLLSETTSGAVFKFFPEGYILINAAFWNLK